MIDTKNKKKQKKMGINMRKYRTHKERKDTDNFIFCIIFFVGYFCCLF